VVFIHNHAVVLLPRNVMGTVAFAQEVELTKLCGRVCLRSEFFLSSSFQFPHFWR
jgi:hypothetical protein